MKAFPSEKKLYWLFRQGDKPIPNEVIEQGMDLRDYFAANAPEYTDSWEQAHCREKGWKGPAKMRAVWNYEYADAMMEERKK